VVFGICILKFIRYITPSNSEGNLYSHFVCFHNLCCNSISQSEDNQNEEVKKIINLNDDMICFSGVNLINILCVRFSYESHFCSFFYVHVIRESCQNVIFVQKICTQNVDEIDSRVSISPTFYVKLWLAQIPKLQKVLTICRRFHQRYTHAFFVQNFGAKKHKCFTQLFSSYVLARKALSYKKHARKMLMKLTPDCIFCAFEICACKSCS